MAIKLSALALLGLVTMVGLGGCNSQAGPNDKAISGKDYDAIVNNGVPENERNQNNVGRGAPAGANQGKH